MYRSCGGSTLALRKEIPLKLPLGRIGVAAAGAAALALAIPGSASAATVSGWVGPATANSVAYLHQSSITDAPYPYAHTAVWTPFGQQIAVNAVGINARMFKGSVLCDATDYVYNGYSTVNFSIGTSAPDCGPGSYNSHGLVRLFNGTSYNTVVTFPTSPVNISDARRAAPEAVEVEPSVTADGLTTGSGFGVEEEADLPDLIAAYGEGGELGYVKKTDLASPELSADQVAALPTTTQEDGSVAATTGPRSVPLYAENGVDVLGQFAIG